MCDVYDCIIGWWCIISRWMTVSSPIPQFTDSMALPLIIALFNIRISQFIAFLRSLQINCIGYLLWLSSESLEKTDMGILGRFAVSLNYGRCRNKKVEGMLTAGVRTRHDNF